MNILITGSGGVTSRAIVRSLKLSERFRSSTFIGMGIYSNRYGLYEDLYSRVYRVPLYNDPAYSSIVSMICQKEGIDAAIVTPEPEVLYWSRMSTRPKSLIPPMGFCTIALSKARLYELLQPQKLAPAFRLVTRMEIINGGANTWNRYPVWMRDAADGTTSGKGSFQANCDADLQAWATIREDINEFMVSDYLPGRNLACCLLFYHGEIVKAICAERISYFMSHLVPSGVTGNTSEGRVFFSNELVATAESAVRLVAEKTGETMNGIVTVDLKEADSGDPLVTEVNLRHVAFTSAFTQAGANMAEAHLLATLGMVEAIDKEPPQINSKNRFFRDIDGLPVFVNQFVVTPVGECSPAKIETSAL